MYLGFKFNVFRYLLSNVNKNVGNKKVKLTMSALQSMFETKYV